MLVRLESDSSLRVLELRQGLRVEIGPHIGSISLSGVRLVVRPKLGLKQVLRMVAYALELGDLVLADHPIGVDVGEHGLIDLLGIALLRAAERLARGGLLPIYLEHVDDLSSPRGRIDVRHAAIHPRTGKLRCTFDDFTTDHTLNRLVAGGLRMAARVMDSSDLRLDLARSAERLLGEMAPIAVTPDALRQVLASLDRRSSHYRTALTLILLINQGSRVQDQGAAGTTPVSGFLLNMNLVFERFLERWLREHSPPGFSVGGQETRADVFAWLENPGRWTQPTIRPDLVFRFRGAVVAVGDAKYKDRTENPPNSAELYQLVTYGLAYPIDGPRPVLLFHPLEPGKKVRPSTLAFAPSGGGPQVRIQLVGVPIERLLEGSETAWWPVG